MSPDIRYHGRQAVELHRIGPPRLWTHLGLGPAALRDRLDYLFVPSHVLPILRPRRATVVLHDTCAEEVPDAYGVLARWYLRMSIADALTRARVITHTEDTRRSLLRLFRADPARVAVVPPAAVAVPPATTALPWPSPFLLVLGRIERRKNVVTIIQAFSSLLDTEPTRSAHLVFLGGGGVGAREFRALLTTLRHRERIHVVGPVDEALRSAALHAAAGVVVPSLCEGWSFVLSEARAAGRPFAASALRACREAGGARGLYVEHTEDVSAWVRALRELLDHPRMPDPPRARTWEDVARDVADVLLRVPTTVHGTGVGGFR